MFFFSCRYQSLYVFIVALLFPISFFVLILAQSVISCCIVFQILRFFISLQDQKLYSFHTYFVKMVCLTNEKYFLSSFACVNVDVVLLILG